MRLKEMVSGWMTDRPETIGPDRPVLEAYALMCEYGIRHLPVMEDGRLVGILSDRDLARRGPLGGTGANEDRVARIFSTRISEIMTRDDLRTVGPMTTLGEAARILIETRTSSLPVLDGEKLVGIITTHDLLRALSGMARLDELVAASPLMSSDPLGLRRSS